MNPGRREFIKRTMQFGALGALGRFGLVSNAMAAAPMFSDYKAMVCIFLYGGNDAYNMLVPVGSGMGTGYTDYHTIRGTLAVANSDLGLSTASSTNTDINNGDLGTGMGNPYYVDGTQSSAYLKGMYSLSGKGIDLGVNGVMPELAQLITDNKASVIANAGTLVRPVTKSQIDADTAELPLFLFAHNHQQRALQTGQANNLDDIGWAGKIADSWNDINNSNDVGLNVSYFGNDRMLIGRQTGPLVLGTNAPPTFTNMNNLSSNAHNDRRALFRALAGEQGTTGRLNFDSTNTYSGNDAFINLFNQATGKSMTTFDSLRAAWDNTTINYASTGSYGEGLFDVPSSDDLGFSENIGGSLIRQLEAAAKFIHMGASGALGTGYNRQVLMVRLGGFDTHSTQADDHPIQLRELSLALWKFQKALEELGHADKVTTFTMSDFGRTMSNNGDGTDHAWGAHHLIMGGSGASAPGTVAGGKMHGSLANVTLGGPDDYSDKGRIIPSTAQDQLNASICDWFGVDETLMRNLFPNLPNFQTGATLRSAYLNGVYD